MTYAGGGGWASVRKYLAPSNMLATQQQHMEAKLRRPMSEKEVMAMRSKAKAQVLVVFAAEGFNYQLCSLSLCAPLCW